MMSRMIELNANIAGGGEVAVTQPGGIVFSLWGMRVAIYIFDLILVLLFFKVFFSKSYSISCPQTNCQRTFFTPTETLPL